MEDIKSESTENLIFIDETGSVLNMTLPYGRSLEGERAFASCPVSKGERISTIGALSTEGLKASMSFEGTLNGTVFLSFLKNILIPELKSGDVVICDNAATHKVANVKELIESKGARMVYLPPYSPEFSPIELCWSKFKHFLRKAKARTKESLHQAISEAVNTITKENSKGWFEHCGYIVE
jgi:transposase